jgi:hypothetical protein
MLILIYPFTALPTARLRRNCDCQSHALLQQKIPLSACVASPNTVPMPLNLAALHHKLKVLLRWATTIFRRVEVCVWKLPIVNYRASIVYGYLSDCDSVL